MFTVLTPASRDALRSKQDKSSDFYGCRSCRTLIVVEKGKKPIGWKDIDTSTLHYTGICNVHQTISDTPDTGLSVNSDESPDMRILREAFDNGNGNSGSHKSTS